MLDLRVPSGWFFATVGVIVGGMGLFSPATRAALTDVNVNLYCGVALSAFGAALLLLARRRA
jgi:hypothetical protein